jgi:hypothetical protein
MDASSHFDNVQIEAPATPQPQHAELPAHRDIPRAMSPTTSLLVGEGSSPPQSFEAEIIAHTHSANRTKYSSPLPPSSSMTPPPSSQPPKRKPSNSMNDRETTPTASLLSSPPPTIPNGIKREVSTVDDFALPTEDEIAEASLEELRELLATSVSQIGRLNMEVREARMSAAHYKLQHNLLMIETEEAAKRMEVEHEMTRREVDVLQMAEHARQMEKESGSQSQHSSSRYIAELKAYCEAMDNENSMLHRRLQRAKKMINQKDDDINAYVEENEKLIKRIRENRAHLNKMRSPGMIYAGHTPRAAPNSGFPLTPQRHRATPNHTPRSMRQETNGNQGLTFDALLLAGEALNDNSNSAPSTPTTSRPTPRSHIRHSRGVQSLSSLPSTPVRFRPVADNAHLLPSVQFAPQSEPRYRSQNFAPEPRGSERSRKSRDSTISASDAEEIANYESEEEEIPESQASQSATELLRQNPRQSFEVVGSPAPSTAEASHLLQAKIFGSVTKPGVEKRKRVDEPSPYEMKKQRTGVEGVGLGIGGWD